MDTILCIANEAPGVARIDTIRRALEKEGFAVSVASEADRGMKLGGALAPALIVVLVDAPDDIDLCRALRESPRTRHLPIVLLLQSGGEDGVLAGFDAGADDVIEAPLAPRIVTARVRAILRRTRSDATVLRDPAIPRHVGPITVDPDRHVAFLRGHPLPLTLAEYRLIEALAARPGRVFSRDQLLEAIAGGETDVTDRNVDVHVKMIRKKLGPDRAFIMTVRGVGYKCRDH